MKYLFSLLLLTSCSLISVNTCNQGDDIMEVDAPNWEKCQEVCNQKDRKAFAGLLYSEGKEPEFHCTCGNQK